MAEPTGDPRTEADLGSGAKPVIAQIDAYEDAYQSWVQRGKKIIERYRDVRMGNANQPINPLVLRKFNILWANVETLKPTLYARLPKIIVEREYKDADPVARIACEIAERAGNWTLRKSGFDTVLRQCVHDRLLPGRAVAWVDYQVEGSDEPLESADTAAGQDEQAEGEGYEQKPKTQFVKKSEKAVPLYVDWADFGHSPVRTWQELDRDGYIWRKVYMDQEACKKRFPDMYGEGKTGVPLDRKPDDTKQKTDTILPQATIYIVYCKKDRMVYWVHKQIPEFLDSKPPAVDLEHFWPCPRPLYSTLTNETMEPVPDFYYYQDQADLLDKIINRMSRIVDAMKVAGVYDKAVGSLQNMFHPNGAPDNILLPVDNWAAFSEKGGITGSFQLAPVDQLAATYQALEQAAQQVLEVIYQITGIADIIRGSSDPNETATAQGIKSNFASLRIKDTQQEVARFSRDLAAMLVEIIVENYEPQYLWDLTNGASFCPMTEQEKQQAAVIKQQGGQPPLPQSFMQAMALLKNQRMRDFRIDIETDSTIALDETVQKQAAIEFIQAVGQFMGQFGPMVQTEPTLAPLAGEMLQFLVRQFHAGRGLEGVIEQTMQQLQQSLQQKAANPQPDPKAAAQIQLQQQKTAHDIATGQQKAQADMQHEQAQAQLDQQHQVLKARTDMATEQQKAATEIQIMETKAAIEARHAEQKHRQQVQLQVVQARQPQNG